jgi:RimJ/RimL family protein N-acetyltransferase
MIALKLLAKGKMSVIFKNIKTRIYSEEVSVRLERYHNKYFKNPKAKIKFSIRLFRNSDLNTLNEFNRHERLVKENIKNCYIAFDEKNNNCYRQWLIGHYENTKIQKYFGNLFPLLNEGEALIEGVFTNPDYRGLNIMPEAMCRISEIGFNMGYKKIIVFVNIKNIPSIKGSIRSGFEPYLIRKEKWFLFTRKVSFTYVPENVKQYVKDIIKK